MIIETDPLSRAQARQRVAEWRDRHLLAVAAFLNQRAAATLDALGAELDEVSTFEALVRSNKAVVDKLDAMLRHAVESDVARLLHGAGAELSAIDRSLEPLARAIGTAAISYPQAEDTKIENPALGRTDLVLWTGEPHRDKNLVESAGRLAREASATIGAVGGNVDQLSRTVWACARGFVASLKRASRKLGWTTRTTARRCSSKSARS